MVRKKQQHPRALLGPPEARQSAEQQDVNLTLTAAPAARGSPTAPRSLDLAKQEFAVVSPIEIEPTGLIQLQHLAIDCKTLSTAAGLGSGQYRLSLLLEGSAALVWEVQDLSCSSSLSATVRAIASCNYSRTNTSASAYNDT